MNKTYLSKIIEQETINVKIQLIKEHIEIARREHIRLLQNKNTADKKASLLEQINKNKNTDSWVGEPMEDAQSFLLNLKCVKTQTNATNKDSYEVTVDINPTGKEDEKKEKYKNLFRFYSDGSVYDYNLASTAGYKLEGNKLVIYAKDPSAFVSIGDNTKLASIDKNCVFTNLSITADETPKNPVLDEVQFWLDYAGVIPVIGDALDAINAIIYFWRGLYFEGFLSCIAIIPVVGSVIKIGVKAALKGPRAALKANKLVQQWFLKGDKQAMAILTKDLIASGKISSSQMQTIGDFFNGTAKQLKGAAKGANSIPGGSSISKSLDDAADAMADGGKTINKTVSDIAANKAKKEAAQKLAEKGAKGWKTPGKIMNFMTGNLIPRMKAMPWYPAKRLAKMTVETESRFIQQHMKNPDRLGILAKFAGKDGRRAAGKVAKDTFQEIENPVIKKELLKIFEKEGADLSKYAKGVKGNQFIDFNNLFKSAKDTEKFFDAMNKNPMLDSARNGFVKNVSKSFVDEGNVLWHMYRENAANKFVSSYQAKALQLSFAKNADWIWNELQAAGITLGLESSEEFTNLGIIPFTKYVIKASAPGGYEKAQEARDIFVKFLGMGRKSAEALADVSGFQISTLDAYPPLGAEQYSYKQDEE